MPLAHAGRTRAREMRVSNAFVFSQLRSQGQHGRAVLKGSGGFAAPVTVKVPLCSVSTDKQRGAPARQNTAAGSSSRSLSATVIPPPWPPGVPVSPREPVGRPPAPARSLLGAGPHPWASAHVPFWGLLLQPRKLARPAAGCALRAPPLGPAHPSETLPPCPGAERAPGHVRTASRTVAFLLMQGEERTLGKSNSIKIKGENGKNARDPRLSKREEAIAKIGKKKSQKINLDEAEGTCTF